jgi:hypothetical protein
MTDLSYASATYLTDSVKVRQWSQQVKSKNVKRSDRPDFILNLSPGSNSQFAFNIAKARKMAGCGSFGDTSLSSSAGNLDHQTSVETPER